MLTPKPLNNMPLQGCGCIIDKHYWDKGEQDVPGERARTVVVAVRLETAEAATGHAHENPDAKAIDELRALARSEYDTSIATDDVSQYENGA